MILCNKHIDPKQKETCDYSVTGPGALVPNQPAPSIPGHEAWEEKAAPTLILLGPGPQSARRGGWVTNAFS